MPDAREELNRSAREGRIESRHSIKSLEWVGSSSHDLGAELRMHSFTVNCDIFSNEENLQQLSQQQVLRQHVLKQCQLHVSLLWW